MLQVILFPMSSSAPAIADAQQHVASPASDVKLRLVLLPGLDGAGLAFRAFAGDASFLHSADRCDLPAGPDDGVSGAAADGDGDVAGGAVRFAGESFSSPLSITIAAARPHGCGG